MPSVLVRDGLDGELRTEQTNHGGGQSDDEAFGKELPDNSKSRRPERPPNVQLALPC
jgi:hypothetical protein